MDGCFYLNEQNDYFSYDIRNLYYKYKTRLVLRFTFKIGQMADAPLLCSCKNHYPEQSLSSFSG